MTNEVLRALLILSATGAVLTIAVYALSPLARGGSCPRGG